MLPRKEPSITCYAQWKMPSPDMLRVVTAKFIAGTCPPTLAATLCFQWNVRPITDYREEKRRSCSTIATLSFTNTILHSSLWATIYSIPLYRWSLVASSVQCFCCYARWEGTSTRKFPTLGIQVAHCSQLNPSFSNSNLHFFITYPLSLSWNSLVLLPLLPRLVVSTAKH